MSLICSNLSRGRRTAQCLHLRWFSVKELSWCAPKNAPRRTNPTDVTKEDHSNNKKRNDSKTKNTPEPISSFGIVAAMSQNRVIGLNGTIPWPRCAQDRRNFKNLTHDGIMIVGRTTYEEDPAQRHISHAKYCIVVSRTLTEDQLLASNQGAPRTTLKVAPSFPDALGLAQKLLDSGDKTTDTSHPTSPDKMSCWVCGGERIYEEALRHKSAQEVHLTTIHLDIDITATKRESGNKQVAYAMFPAKHRWDRHFTEISRVEGGPTDDDPTSPRFTYVTYHKNVY